MLAYKDKTQGTWYVSFRYVDWTGKKTQKLKRGFKIKKEALNYEKEFIRKTAADMKMEMNLAREWYLVGTPYCGNLEYVQARIPG